jgi:hypothetical protein
MADSDTEPLRAAFNRLEQRKRHAAEVEKEIERELNLKPITREQRQDLGKMARELASQDRLISKMEAFMKKDYATFMERFSDHYARLTGETTN